MKLLVALLALDQLGSISKLNCLLRHLSRQRPYHVESTSSRPITEVKQRWAQLVFGRETAWELWVLLATSIF